MKVLSCPFCGCNKVDLCRTNVNACWVACVSCGAEAESDPKREDAIRNWNRRRAASVATIEYDEQCRDSHTVKIR